MIDTKEYAVFKDFVSTLKDTSFDKTNNVYMTESLLEVINFDEFAHYYAEQCKISGTPRTNDALFISNDGEIVFIEFKNGVIGKSAVAQIKEKVYSSSIILMDVLNEKVDYIRSNVQYILVYNRFKNSRIDIDSSLDKLSNKKSTYKVSIGETFLDNGINIFKRFCYKEVYAYNEEDFDKNFVKPYEAKCVDK